MSVSRPFRVISENYGTYVNDVTKARESHWKRILGQLAFSTLIALLIKSISDNAISVLITSISILIGFAFTALFPIAGDGIGKLSTPSFAEDWDDIRRIKHVIKNFRKNVSYFIPLCLIFILFLFLQMVSLNDTAHWFRSLVNFKMRFCQTHECWFDVNHYFSILRSLATIFVLLEISYTFYRMCFNALSILRIKDEYEDGRMNAGR